MDKYERSSNYVALAVGVAMLCRQTSSYAEETFNPAFISSDIASVADLKRFAEGNLQPDGSYKVDIYLNNEYISTQSIDFNTPKKEENNINSNLDGTGLVPCLTKNTLDVLHLNTKLLSSFNDTSISECLSLSQMIPEASVRFDFEQQRLYFSIPQAALLNVSRGYVPPKDWDNGIPAVLLDYNFTGSNNQNALLDNHSSSYFFRLNSGINIGAWRFRNESIYTYNKNSNNTYKDWNNINSYAQRGINSLKSTLTIGDSYTSGDIFDSVGIRGIQLASNDDMLPESQRGFAPTIHGVANSNAKVTLKQNGFIIYETHVAPGPFVINDLYQTLSSGDIKVSIDESNGSVNEFTVPYSAVPILQREGRLKYSLSMGEYRSGDINKDKPKFLQSTAILGLKKGGGLTLYGGTQLSNNYKSFLFGGGVNLGNWGAVSADITHANTTLVDDNHYSGQSLRFLYAKSLIDLGTRVQLLGYRYSTKGFYTFGESAYNQMSQEFNNEGLYDDGTSPFLNSFNLNYTKKGRFQATISQNVNKLGSLYLSGNHQKYWNTNKTTESVQFGFSWSRKIANYNLAYSFSKNPWVDKADHTVAFSVSLPLEKLFKKPNPSSPYTKIGNTAYATYSVFSTNHGQTNNQFGLTGTLLENNNLSYSVLQNVNKNNNNTRNNNASYAGVNWQTGYGRFNAAYNYTEDNRQFSYGASGGMIIHKDGVTLGQSLGNTNVLIKVPKAKDVLIDNTTGITTDSRGYAIVPYVSPYQRNRVALQTSSLKRNVEIDETVKNVVPTQGAVVIANYSVRIGVRALFTLLRANGSPVPFGAKVSVVGVNGSNSIVGSNGEVYLPGLALQGQLNVSWGNLPDQQCQLAYELPKESEKLSVSRLQLECK